MNIPAFHKMKQGSTVSEHDIQCRVVRYFDAQYRQFAGILFAVPNGGLRHVATAKKMKAEGVRRGVPDLWLPVPRNGYHGLAIEMKSEKGRLSQEQKKWIDFLVGQNYRVEVCWSFDDAKNVIGEYLS